MGYAIRCVNAALVASAAGFSITAYFCPNCSAFGLEEQVPCPGMTRTCKRCEAEIRVPLNTMANPLASLRGFFNKPKGTLTF